jgi:hypothetical protein
MVLQVTATVGPPARFYRDVLPEACQNSPVPFSERAGTRVELEAHWLAFVADIVGTQKKVAWGSEEPRARVRACLSTLALGSIFERSAILDRVH